MSSFKNTNSVVPANKLKAYIKPAGFLILGLILGFFIAKIYFFAPKPQPEKIISQQDSRTGQGKFTNPLLECKEGLNEYTELRPFKSKIENLVLEQRQKPEIKKVSVYFRDLNNGPWFGLDEQDAFSPASLLKVPLAIAYYKLSESNPDLLKKELVYQQQSDLPFVSQNIKPKEGLELGKAYTAEELIRRMLEYSDNEAYSVLIEALDFKDLKNIYSDFGIDLGQYAKTDEIVNVQSYSSFFRILYNASYLNRADSEKILAMLAETDFKSGLVAGVPGNITITHKFGERGDKDSADMQFSDCGIVYYPGWPYVLCVMTKGTDINKQIETIKNISFAVYREIDSQKQ